VWLNSEKRVVYLQQDISPKTYPKTYCTPTAAQYVLELKASVAQTLAIRMGSQLQF
jgi:uncharacterized membrane protein (UPF0127 family)